MPDTGTISNYKTDFMTQWESNSKGLPQELESALTSETCTQFFDTLAEWNGYLEQHVPYFNEPEDSDDPQP